jgi:serine/threonine-protein kinase
VGDVPTEEPDATSEDATVSGSRVRETPSEAETVASRPRPSREAETVADTPTSPQRSSNDVDVEAPSLTAPSASSQSFTTTSPLLTLHRDEYERSRLYLKMDAALSTAVLVALPFMGGEPIARGVIVFGMLLGIVSSAILFYRLRDPANYTPGLLAVAGLINSVIAYCGVFYFGFFSPAPAIYVLGIYFYGFSGSQQVTRFVYIVCALEQGVTALLIGAGVVPDLGLIRATDLPIRDQILAQLLFQVLLLCSFLLARYSRRATLEQVGQLEHAVRQVSMREALLREAREELDRALQIGGPGLMTGLLVGSYQMGNLIGRGGMGEVYEAKHEDEGHLAAVKVLRRDALGSRERVTRFLREAEVASQLDVPNVVKLLEVGRTRGEVPYLAMELLEGADLAHHLRESGRMRPRQVVELITQVGAALDAARAAGIVHRDIKPQNLFLANQGGERTWKVLDFGVSKLTDGSSTLTKDHVVGTPGYMAPEQARGEDVDHRTDLYALGIVVYRALTGRPPFSGEDLRNVLYEVVFGLPEKPSSLVTLPDDVDFALAIAMAKDKAQRFDSGAEMAAAFEAALGDGLEEGLRERARAVLKETPWRERGSR